MDEASLIVGAASRPHPNETANGDAWLATWHEGRFRLAVIDGLGHGPDAARAAAVAVEALRTQPQLGPADALRACHRALMGTRGAVAGVASLDSLGKQLVYAGVGNVEARLWYGGRHERPISYRGVLGAALPTVREFTFALEDDWLLLLHSDGVQSRADPNQLRDFAARRPRALAEDILIRWGRARDDATAVVVCPARRTCPVPQTGGATP